MDGRWQLMVAPDGRAPGAARKPDEAALRHGWSCTPVVPCDDAAVERIARALASACGWPWDKDTASEFTGLAQLALHAAGETS